MDQGGNQLSLLLHTLAELFGFLFGMIGKVKLGQELG
jgi:hypothetical protein